MEFRFSPALSRIIGVNGISMWCQAWSTVLLRSGDGEANGDWFAERVIRDLASNMDEIFAGMKIEMSKEDVKLEHIEEPTHDDFDDVVLHEDHVVAAPCEVCEPESVEDAPVSSNGDCEAVAPSPVALESAAPPPPSNPSDNLENVEIHDAATNLEEAGTIATSDSVSVPKDTSDSNGSDGTKPISDSENIEPTAN